MWGRSWQEGYKKLLPVASLHTVVTLPGGVLVSVWVLAKCWMRGVTTDAHQKYKVALPKIINEKTEVGKLHDIKHKGGLG